MVQPLVNEVIPRRRAEQKAETRRRLLEAAKEAFAEKGYGETQIRDIVGRAGTAIGTFYVHFQNKRGIFREILDEMTQDLVQLMTRRVAASPTTLLRVRALYESFLDYMSENWNLFILLREGRESESEFAPELRAAFELLSQNLEQILAHGMDKGEIVKTNPRVLARALVGMAVEAIALQHEEGLDRLEVRATLDQLVVYGLVGEGEIP